MKKLAFATILLLFSFQFMHAGNGYPRLLVTNDDKEAVLQKIEKHPWAETIYREMFERVDPYVRRHADDPEWILSRYLMNRVEGKRYTHAYDNGDGHYLVSYSGDAPVPTVRVSSHKRSPLTASGAGYRCPSLEEVIPYDTARYIWALNPETNEKDYIDPQSFISDINGRINQLALQAAVIYWLHGDEKYARFAADILDQWAHGASYQEPIVGACRTGFLDIQTLGDNSYQSLILAYDFVRPFLEKEGYVLSYYQNVFEKFASTLTFRGFWNNNWYAAVTSTLVYAALSLDDQEKRDYYLQFVINRDTINGSCGHLSLATTVDHHLTHDGHWREPGGYHNFPVSNLVKATLALEKNGYNIYNRFPELFQATYALIKYSFPNLTVSAFGDTGRASQDAESLEMGLVIAAANDRPELPEMMSAMHVLMENGRYNRSRSGLFGMLTFLPDFPATERVTYQWPRTGYLDFARLYLQRNGMDRQTGLMVAVQGASYNHNHCNGMAMELYGCGEVVGIDAGTGPNYEHPLHQNYYSQWAAHNTVVAAGASGSVPFSGGAGRKNIGAVELAAMEPMPDREALSPWYSFSDTRYLDPSTNTNQLRTLAIIRTSDTTGYYIDIYRSDNPVSNDYVYHNIGDDFAFYDAGGEMIPMKPAAYPLTGEDHPGFRFFSDVEKLDNHNESLQGLFTIKGSDSEKYVQTLIPGSSERTYYKANSLPAKTAGRRYSRRPLPLFTIRAEQEAWSQPFIVLYEPYAAEQGSSVVSVEKVEGLCNDKNTALRVVNRDGSQQIILQGNSCETTIQNEKIRFSGHFGVIDLDREGKPERLYLGEGKVIAYEGLSVTATDDMSSASVDILGDHTYSVSGNHRVIIDFATK